MDDNDTAIWMTVNASARPSLSPKDKSISFKCPD